MEKGLLRVFGVLGTLLFLPLFLLTFTNPQAIEQAAQSFISERATQASHAKIDALALPPAGRLEGLLGAKAKQLRQRADARLKQLKALLKADAPALIAAQIAKARQLDCECRQQWQAWLTTNLVSEKISLEAVKTRLTRFAQAKYVDVMTQLLQDLRIFLGGNLLVFVLFLLASVFRAETGKALFIPAILLLLSTALCSFFYLFEQNWLYTLIYNDYTGYSFLGYQALVFLLLCDIAFNKARVVDALLTMLSNALQATLKLLPC